jgi:hypothetical protein
MTRTPSLFMLTTLLLWPLAGMADCTYRPDSLGNTRYQCDNGQSGTLHQDALGNVRDSGTDTTWRKDALGNLRSSEGDVYRKDALGNLRGSDGTTWRTDSLGNLRSSEGTVCRKDALGTLRCDGDEAPPVVFEGGKE